VVFLAGSLKAISPVAVSCASRISDPRSQSIREQFGLVRDEMLVDAHAQSLPRIREECSKIRNDVGRRKWEAINIVMTTYSGLTKNDIENRDMAHKAGSGSNNAPPANYSLGRARLTELLAEMAKQAE
jgi:hypothetical protein